jgi:hypothetical protein
MLGPATSRIAGLDVAGYVVVGKAAAANKQEVVPVAVPRQIAAPRVRLGIGLVAKVVLQVERSVVQIATSANSVSANCSCMPGQDGYNRN